MSGHFVRDYELWRMEDGVDDFGQPIPGQWQQIGTIRGRAYPGHQSYNAAIFSEFGSVVWTFACNASEDVSKDDQIRFDGKVLSVKATAITSRGKRMQSLCHEVQS